MTHCQVIFSTKLQRMVTFHFRRYEKNGHHFPVSSNDVELYLWPLSVISCTVKQENVATHKFSLLYTVNICQSQNFFYTGYLLLYQTWVRSCFGFRFAKPKHFRPKLQLRLQLRAFKNSKLWLRLQLRDLTKASAS